MWYELTPAPGMAGDQIEFLKRAQRAAGALGLCDRPNITDPPTWDEGCLIVATLQRRWVVRRGAGTAVPPSTGSPGACGSTAAESDAPEILSEPLKWAHAYVPSGATLNRTAQDDESGGGDLRLAPPENGLIALNVRRIGHWEDDRLTDWLADEFNTQPDSSKLRRTACPRPASWPPRTTCAKARTRPSRPPPPWTWGSRTWRPIPAIPAWAPSSSPSFSSSSLSRWRFRCCGGPPCPDFRSSAGPCGARRPWDRTPDLTVRPRHRWWTARTRVARSSDLKTRSMGDEPTFGDKRRIHAYAFQRSTFPLPAGALAACACLRRTARRRARR